MASEVGSCFVSVLPSTSGFGRSLNKQIASPSTKAGQVSGGKFRTGILGSLKGLGGVLAGTLVVGAGVNLFKDAVGGASDLNETMSKVGVVFGKDALPALEKFAGGAAKSLGQSKQAALDGAANFGIFGKSAGLTGGKLVNFSSDLVGLAGDMASFSNTTPQEATEALGAALRGESEPIRKYGVLLDDATLRAEALKLGLIDTVKDALTPQQKILAAQSQIFKQTGDAQGDFERTSGGLANQQRILSASWENAKTSLGTSLLPVMTKVVTFLNTTFIPAVTKIAGAFEKGGLSGGLSKIGQMISGALPVIRTKLLQMGSAFIGWIKPYIPIMLGKLGALLARLGAWIQGTGWPRLKAKLAMWGRALWGWIKPQIPVVIAKVNVLLGRLNTWIVNVGLPKLLKKMGKWGNALVDWIEPRIPGMLQKLGVLIGRFQVWMLTVGLPRMVKSFLKIGWELTKAQVKMKPALFRLGRAIIWGVIKGIGSMGKELGKAMVNQLPGPVKGFAQKLGIGSPSKVFAKFGVNIGEGLIQGINSTSGPLNKTLGGVATRVSDSFQGSLTDPVGPKGRKVAALRHARQADVRHPVTSTGGQVHLTVNNPLPERAAESTANSLRRLSWTHGLAVA